METDLTTLLRTLLSVEYMATFANTRYPLYVAFSLIIAVDCSGRVGEFVPPSKLSQQVKLLAGSMCPLSPFGRPPASHFEVEFSLRI